jgi:uncharacterized protein YndB with AHSA1/START domain
MTTIVAVKGGSEVSTPSDREIQITRSFKAPRQLVWDAFTKPALIKRWLGLMPGWTFPVCEVDLRVGGRYRYLWRGPDGHAMGLSGTFVEVKPTTRLASNESFDEKWYEGECLVTTLFEEADGKTTMRMILRYDSREFRDAVLQSPMADGVEFSFSKLDAALPALAKD